MSRQDDNFANEPAGDYSDWPQGDGRGCWLGVFVLLVAVGAGAVWDWWWAR